MEKEQFRVSGMTCASCAAIIERTLKKIDGVSSVAVNVATEQAAIDYDPALVTMEQMNVVLKGHGYTLTRTSPEEPASNTHNNTHPATTHEGHEKKTSGGMDHSQHAAPGLRADREKEVLHGTDS